MKSSAVLVLATDPLSGALIGAAVELAGYAPVFPSDGESSRDALLRTRPCVVLVDCDDEHACAKSFFGPAMMAGSQVAVFSSSRSKRTIEPIAEQFGVRAFRLPIDIE